MHKLKAAREKLGLSQNQFASQVLGISVRTLQSWEINQRTPRGLALLALEEKLTKIRPASLGQAGRVSGITPADLAVLLFYLG